MKINGNGKNDNRISLFLIIKSPSIIYRARSVDAKITGRKEKSRRIRGKLCRAEFPRYFSHGTLRRQSQDKLVHVKNQIVEILVSTLFNTIPV